MNCYEPGEVLVLPSFDGPPPPSSRDEARRFLDREVIYTIADILRTYEIGLPDLPAHLKPLPIVIRVDEGEEEHEAERLMGRKDIQLAVPNYRVELLQKNLSGLNLNHPEIEEAIKIVTPGHPHLKHKPSNGAGVSVVVIDSGVSPDALKSPKVLHHIQFATDRPEQQAPYDRTGHGSTVAHIINRLAPGATIYSIKMMDEIGNLGGLLAALVIAEARYHPDIYNLSLALSCNFDTCPHCHRSLGPVTKEQLPILFSSCNRNPPDASPLLVAAAGNDVRTVAIPATLPNALAVGGYDRNSNHLALYSSKYSDVPIDRFIVAPGGSSHRDSHLALGPTTGFGRTPKFFGTSFSAAFVSGVSALYLSTIRECDFLPKPRVNQTRELLMNCLKRSSIQIPNCPTSKQGLGILNFDEFVAHSFCGVV